MRRPIPDARGRATVSKVNIQFYFIFLLKYIRFSGTDCLLYFGIQFVGVRGTRSCRNTKNKLENGRDDTKRSRINEKPFLDVK